MMFKPNKKIIYRILSSLRCLIITMMIAALLLTSATTFAFADNNSAIPDNVTLQLRWEHQFQFAGYYAALWEGYYDEAGLNVDIRPGIDEHGNVIIVPDAINNGDADFGVGGVDILLALNEGQDLRIISTIFQRSPVAFYLLPETRFNSTYDFTKLNVARREHDLLDIELQAMLIDEGINPSKVHPLPKDIVLSFDDLRNGTYDVIPGYLDTIAYQAHLQGFELDKIQPIEYGVDFYGDSIFTSGKLAESRPQMVERFRLATLKGWAYALDNPEEMAQRIADHFYKDSRNYLEFVDFNKFQAGKVTELTLYPVVEIGNMNPYRWTNMIDYLTVLELIDSPIDTTTILFDYGRIQQEKSALHIRLYQSLLVILAVASLFGYIWYMKRQNFKLQSEVKFRKETEQRISLSHERYQRMFNSSFLGITVTDINGNLLRANDKWADMTGYNHDELVNMSIFDILSPSSKESGKQLFKQLRDNEVQEIDLERLYRRSDQTEFWGQLYMTAIRDPETKATNFLGMVHDITEKKMQREAAERAEAMVIYQARQAAMGEMVGNIAHQWRQPLNNLGLILTNIEDAYRFEDLDDRLMFDSSRRAKNLIKQMSETIDDFQDFLNPSLDSESFDLDDMIDGVIELVQDSLNFNMIEINRVGRLNAIVTGQKNQLSQAIFNIINNAVDAIKSSQTENRELVISTEIQKLESNDYIVLIEITDHAGGVPEDVLEKVFEPYFTTKPKDEGTGLGLYITKSIIENSFDGSIELSLTDTGTRFAIKIPLGR